MTIADNIKALRRKYGITQAELGEIAGLTDRAVSAWERGEAEPRMGAIEKIATHFGIPKSQIIDELNAQNKPLATLPLIPLYGTIPAGSPNLTNNDVLERIPYDPSEAGDYYALTIHGASMEPTLMDGDVVYVRYQPDVQSGDIAIVSIGMDSGTCKEVQVYPNGIMLVGHNHDAFTPRFFTADEVRDLPVTIQGKVVGMSRKFR